MVNTKIRLIIFFAAKDREALYSQQKTRPGADCGSDHELLIVKFKLKLKKVGKTTGPFSDREVAQSCPTLCDPMATRFLRPWNFLGKSTGVGCHFILQGIFLTQRSNPCLLHGQEGSLQPSHQWSPYRVFCSSQSPAPVLPLPCMSLPTWTFF